MEQLSFFPNPYRYIIDTSAILSQKPNELHRRTINVSLWKKIDELIKNQEIVTCSEIFEEVKDEELKKLLVALQCKVLDIDDEIKKKIEKEKIENFVVSKTMEFLKDDDIVNKLAQLLFDLQYEENTLLPRLESQVEEKKKEIENIVTAIQKGVASETLMQCLGELEEQKKVFEEQLAKERLNSPLFTKEQFKMSLCNLRKINTNTKEGKAKLIDTFIGRIYLFDDHIKIIYNIEGKDEEITLEELESSISTQCGQPILGGF